MEDFIYILIGIAWIGFSIYSQQKKLKKKQEEAAARKTGGVNEEATEHEAAEKSLFEKLFEDYEAEETAYEPVEQQTKQHPSRETIQTDRRYSSVEQAASREEMMEANSVLSSDYYKSTKGNEKQKKVRETIAEEILEDDSESWEEKSRDFDLRKAVIYSAILERPYD